MIPILRLIAWLHLQSVLVFASADVWLFFLVLAPKLQVSYVLIFTGLYGGVGLQNC